ncbi:MAG: lipoate--protein ligase family protein [Verrucomicrobia bacterium]|nr:lipoate--protein ligase family protein [Verrucomicrobiota bacterium]
MDTWHLWNDAARDPALNMALDEALLRTAGERGRPLLRVYRWNAPAVSIGFFQKFAPELAPGRPVVRRPTGGGLVDHARDATYTVVAPPGHALYRMPTAESYRAIHEAVAAALQRLGVAARLAPCCAPERSGVCFAAPVKFDVVADGRKVAGAAQRRLKCGLLHQGSVLLPAAAKLNGELRIGFEKALGVTFERFEPAPALLAVAEKLRADKYATAAWTGRFRT